MLPNGLTVLAREDRAAPVVAVVTYVKAGYFDEPDEVVGIAHVLEHMYFKGTALRGPGAMARETKRAGGYLNAGTIYDRTSYYTVLPASGLETGIALQADAFANSVIDEGELARELEVIIEEERRKRDTPGAVAVEECYALLHDVHRVRRWRIGTAEGLRRLTRDDVLAFYRRHYTPGNTVVAVVGDASVDDMLRTVERHYGSIAPAPPYRDRGPAEPERTGFRWRELVRDVEHTQVVLAWRTAPPTHPDSAALDVAGVVLGAGRASRLYREVRERSLASAVSAYHYTPTELGIFAVSAQVPRGRSPAATGAAWAQVRALGTAGPSEAELARTRRVMDARWRRALESMEGQAMYLASWEALGSWELGAGNYDALMSVGARDVSSVVARYLTLDRAALVTLRPEGTDPIAADLPGARDVLAKAPVVAHERREAATVEAQGLVGLGVSPEQVTAGVAVFRTDGGVPILVRQKAGAPIAYVEAVFAGGACDETATRAGRTNLLSRLALQGTAHRDGPQFNEDVESLGASIGSFVGAETFGWTLSVPTAQLGRALALFSEAVEEPLLGDVPLTTERTIALAALAQMRDDMSRRPVQLALETAFGDHPYGRTPQGTEAGLRRTSVSRLRSWHERHVRQGQGAIVVVADASPDEIAAVVRGAFRALAAGHAQPVGAPAWPDSPRESVESRDKAQAALALLFPGPRRADATRYAAGMLATVASGLGGRVFEALRERESLAYSVHVGVRSLRHAGWMSAYLACAPEKEAAARAGLLRELSLFAEHPVTADELERARAYTLGSIAIRQQSAASVLADVADAWMFGELADLAALPARIAAVTAADLQRVARESFDPSRAVWGAVRPGRPR